MIEGLVAAHDAGIIHRDVKPSNCFLDDGGRVKVGDFGLSKSLLGDSALTRTGAFMGTPQYAAPEQITGGMVDQRTDVYAVGGTLFYLLTGRAPFTGDAAKVIAGIAAEPAPNIRSVNNSIPLGLASIIAQSLEKNREKRQHDLTELYDALLPFSSRENAMADLGRRLAAYVLDTLVAAMLTIYLTMWAMFFGVMIASNNTWFDRASDMPALLIAASVAFGQLFSVVGYFGYFEGFYGATPGKRLLGLKTVGPKGGNPGLWRAALRALIVPGIASFLITLYSVSSIGQFNDTPQDSWHMFVMTVKSNLTPLAGWTIMLMFFVTARKSNGYRGFHEIATQTRVVRVSRRSQVAREKTPQTLPRRSEPEEQFEGYDVVGMLGACPGGNVYLAKEENLARIVWIYCFDDHNENPFSSDARKVLGRPTRQRFLDHGTTESGQHFAVVEAVVGSPLFSLPKSKKIDWDDAVNILDELTAELESSARTESMPELLNTDQIWLDTNNQLKLVELPIAAEGTPLNLQSHSATAVLKEFARQIKRRCIVPGRYLDVFDELSTRDDSDERAVAWLRSQLGKDRAEGVSWGWDDRLGVLAVSSSIEGLFAYILSTILAFGIWSLVEFEVVPLVSSLLLAMLFFTCLQAVAVVSGYVFNGGLSFWIANVEVRRSDGRSASKWRMAIRNFVAWTPGFLFLAFSASSIADSEARFEMANRMATQQPGFWITTNSFPGITSLLGLVVVACAIYAIARPTQGVQDLICQTRIGPK